MYWQFSMDMEKTCQIVCRIDKLTAKSEKAFKEKIDDEYRVNM